MPRLLSIHAAFAFGIALALGTVAGVNAQVHGPGPSDPSLFDTVINLPPDPNLGDHQRIGLTQLNVRDGGSVGSFFGAWGGEVNISGGTVGRDFSATGSEVNISGGSVDSFLEANTGSMVNISGGRVGHLFNANAGSEVNVSGGTVDHSFQANSDSVINISGGDVGYSFLAFGGSAVNLSGGTVDGNFRAFPGSVVRLSGGTVGSGFSAHSGSDVELIGGDFRLNESPFAGSTIDLIKGDVFSGTLQDGSAFIFSPDAGDTLIGVTLTPTALPPVDSTPIVVATTMPNRPSGLRAGQTLTLRDGGELGNNFEAVDATLSIEGGILGRYAGAVRSLVNISGGNVGLGFNASPGSAVNISGGTVGALFDANPGSEVTLSGGTVGQFFSAPTGSLVEVFGGEFELNGSTYAGSTITLGQDDVFTGTLQDGSSFIFSPAHGDTLIGVQLTPTALPPRETTPLVVDTAFPARPSGLRAGQSLTLQDGGELGSDFEVVNATLIIDGGTVGRMAGAVRSTVHIDGGTVGNLFNADSGSVVNVGGGVVGDSFNANAGSVVNLDGGAVGTYFNANAGSVVNLSGGSVGHDFRAHAGSVVNIRGGTWGGRFIASAGSEVNLMGMEFRLNGIPVEGLVMGEAFTITERGMQLSGLLADGTSFEFWLNTTSSLDRDILRDGSKLTVTLVPELESLSLSVVVALGVFIRSSDRR